MYRLGGVAINWCYLQNYWRNTSILSSVMGNHFFTKYVWNKYKPLTTNCARTRRQFTWTQSCVQLHKEWLAGLLHARQHPLNDCTECVEIQHRTVTGLPKGKRSSVHSTTLPSLYFETLQSNSSYWMKTKSFNTKLVHLYFKQLFTFYDSQERNFVLVNICIQSKYYRKTLAEGQVIFSFGKISKYLIWKQTLIKSISFW